MSIWPSFLYSGGLGKTRTPKQLNRLLAMIGDTLDLPPTALISRTLDVLASLPESLVDVHHFVLQSKAGFTSCKVYFTPPRDPLRIS